jgi:hypothetical protein
MKTTHRICGRKGCNEHGSNKANGNGTTCYCEKHYRFLRMRDTAQQDGKVVPTWEHLDEMLLECLNEHGELGGCPSCGQQMQWKAGADKKIGPTISLQHNRDGTMRFICHSCNVGHGSSKVGDLYFDIGYDEKYCPDCDTVKPLDQFNKNRSNGGGVQSRCRECQSNRSRKYHAAISADPIKRAEYLAKQRAYYHANAQQEVLA